MVGVTNASLQCVTLHQFQNESTPVLSRSRGEVGVVSLSAIRQNRHQPRGFFKATTAGLCSAGFQTCCIADFQVGRTPAIMQSAGLETRDTADLEVCATGVAAPPRCDLCALLRLNVFVSFVFFVVDESS
jgi:hypothetical protein